MWIDYRLCRFEDTWILQNTLENKMFQRIVTLIIVGSYEMDFMKGNFIVVRIDGMCSIWKTATHYLLVKRWRWNWMIKVFAGVCPWMSRFHLVRDTAAEKVLLQKIWIPEVYLELNGTSLMNFFFAKTVNGVQLLTIVSNKLYHRFATKF